MSAYRILGFGSGQDGSSAGSATSSTGVKPPARNEPVDKGSLDKGSSFDRPVVTQGASGNRLRGPKDPPTAPVKQDFAGDDWLAGSRRPSWFSPTAAQSLADGAPVASTGRARAAGLVPPDSPKLFPGARVRVVHPTRGEVLGQGAFVGYDRSGAPLVRDASGRLSSPSGQYQIELEPGQEFASILESVPPRNRFTPGEFRAGLKRLLETSVGFGQTTLGQYVAAIKAAGFETLVVGGAVRDVIEGKPPRDVDIVTSMWVEDASRAFSRAGLPSGYAVSQYGTLLVGRGSSGLDVTSLKREEGKFGLDLLEDARHRDFTINALYYDPHSETIADPYGTGVSDVRQKVLRPACRPGEERAWIRQNPSAVLRIFKFIVRGYKPTAELKGIVLENFRSAVADMDGLRLSRVKESLGGSASEMVEAMRSFGLSDEDIRRVYRWEVSRGDGDEDAPRYWRPKVSQLSQDVTAADSDPRGSDTVKQDNASAPRWRR